MPGFTAKPTYFDFMELPIELRIKIVAFATYLPFKTKKRRERVYDTARSLALVSRHMKEIVMPYLLGTVVLRSQESVDSFIEAVYTDNRRTADYRRNKIGHLVEYSRHVKALWATECLEPFIFLDCQPRACHHEYSLLYNIFAQAEVLGFNFNALHLLYEVLGEPRYADRLPEWQKKRLVFAGEGIRWNCLTQPVVGQLFLGSITHLTIWKIDQDPEIPEGGVPPWVTNVPFRYMTALTHFAFTLTAKPRSVFVSVVVYILPGLPGSKFKTWDEAGYPGTGNATVFKEWATTRTGEVFGWKLLIPVNLGLGAADDLWEMAFAKWEHDQWIAPKASAGRGRARSVVLSR